MASAAEQLAANLNFEAFLREGPWEDGLWRVPIVRAPLLVR